MNTASDKRPMMLSLISEQAIPNVMGALLVEPRPRMLVCLLPKDRERPGKIDSEFFHVFNGIRDAIKKIDSSIQVVINATGDDGELVSPYDANQVRKACQAIRNNPQYSDGTWVYNITGGTKVMAQAALDDARENNQRSVYVDTEWRRLIWDCDIAVDFDEVHLESIGVEEYLAAYGVTVKAKEKSLDTDLRYAARLLGQNPAGPSLVEKIALGKNPRKSQEVECKFNQKHNQLSDEERDLLFELVSILSDRCLKVTGTGDTISLNLEITEDMRRFFWGGAWLESYTFDTICRLHQVQSAWRYNLPCRNLLLEWSGIQYSGFEYLETDDLVRPSNELDVAATRGGRLLICECKTGTNAMSPEHLYKLQVIGHKTGTFADKVLVTTLPNLLDLGEKTNSRSSVIRALILNIAVVQRSQLPVLEKILADPEKELRAQKRRFNLVA